MKYFIIVHSSHDGKRTAVYTNSIACIKDEGKFATIGLTSGFAVTTKETFDQVMDLFK